MATATNRPPPPDTHINTQSRSTRQNMKKITRTTHPPTHPPIKIHPQIPGGRCGSSGRLWRACRGTPRSSTRTPPGMYVCSSSSSSRVFSCVGVCVDGMDGMREMRACVSSSLLSHPQPHQNRPSIGWPHLEDSITAFKDHPGLTALVPDIAGVDPDDAFSSVPYEKGFSLLVLVEQIVRGFSLFWGLWWLWLVCTCWTPRSGLLPSWFHHPTPPTPTHVH